MSDILNILKTKFNKARNSFCFEITPDNMVLLIKHIEKLESLSHTITESECAIKAHDDEPVFILLGRDAQAHIITRLWGSLRAMAEGPSEQTDAAFKRADEMEKYHDSI